MNIETLGTTISKNTHNQSFHMPGRFCCGTGDEGPAVGGSSYCWCVTGDWCAYFSVPFVYLSIFLIDLTVSSCEFDFIYSRTRVHYDYLTFLTP